MKALQEYRESEVTHLVVAQPQCPEVLEFLEHGGGEFTQAHAREIKIEDLVVRAPSPRSAAAAVLVR